MRAFICVWVLDSFYILVISYTKQEYLLFWSQNTVKDKLICEKHFYRFFVV